MSGPPPDASPGASSPLSPRAILRLSGEEADAVLDRLEEDVPVSPHLVGLDDRTVEEALVFGDTHGDWRSTLAAAERFLRSPSDHFLVGLGDYLDRAPADCGEGSVANAIYLLELAARFPNRVFLVQGNHETNRILPVLPHDLPEQVDRLWGPDPERVERIIALLERGPFAAWTPNGAYLAHGGFPRRHDARENGRAQFTKLPDEEILDIVWGDCGASRLARGVTPPFTERELSLFLESIGAKVMVRGHDPDLIGQVVFGGRCLTIHTTRVFERYGGVLLARIPLSTPLTNARAIALEHLETEGRTFPEPD